MEWFRVRLRIIVLVLVTAMAVPFLITILGITR
jgi:hypothetical protein